MLGLENSNLFIDFVVNLIKYVISPTAVFLLIGKIYGFGELSQKFKTALADILELKNGVVELKANMVVVRTYLVTTLGLKDSLFKAKSPLQLEHKGIRLLDASGFKDIYEKNKNVFLERFKQFKHETDAEIDEASVSIMMSMKDDVLLSNFKNVAFENGVLFEVLLKVCAIYLRERAIEDLRTSVS